FDQSAMFKKVYEEEFGIFGGAPFGALLGDYEFDKTGEDIELLEKVAQVAAAAHAPFLSGTSSKMFSLDSFTQLDAPRDLAKIFNTTDYAKWKTFRESEDSRYVALAAPRMLLREPYGSQTVPIEAFQYEEQVTGDHNKYLWGNAAWARGVRITNAFATYGWCATRSAATSHVASSRRSSTTGSRTTWSQTTTRSRASRRSGRCARPGSRSPMSPASPASTAR